MSNKIIVVYKMASDLFPSNSKNNTSLMKFISVVVLGIVVLGLVLSVAGCIETKYTVTYAPGTHGTFSPQVTNNLSNGTRTPNAPAVTGSPGYIFNGWSPAVRSTVTGNVTYTAQWIQERYTVTYAPGTHGTFASRITTGHVYGTSTPIAPTVTGASGYNFDGWSPAIRSTVTENITYTAQWVKAPPNVTATSTNLRGSVEGLHYYTYVDVSVHNYGGAGTAVVWTTVRQDGKEWTRSQTVYLNERESKDLTFRLIEPSLWGSTTYASIWVENIR